MPLARGRGRIVEHDAGGGIDVDQAADAYRRSRGDWSDRVGSGYDPGDAMNTNAYVPGSGDRHIMRKAPPPRDNKATLELAMGGAASRYDDGGEVEGDEVGGIAPSNATANPQTQGMIQRYSSMPQEKLAQLAVMMGGSPQGRVIQQILAQKRTQPQEQSRGGVTHRAVGGQMSMPQWSRAQQAQEVTGRGASGYLHGSTPGRADAILTTAPGGSHVLSADVVSGLGEGNSLAGAKVLDRLFHIGPHGVAMPKGGRGMGMPRAPAPYREAANGGDLDEDDDDETQTPVALSHGEWVATPAQVRAIGGGDRKLGHKILDAFQVSVRKMIIEMMEKLPGPVKSR